MGYNGRQFITMCGDQLIAINQSSYLTIIRLTTFETIKNPNLNRNYQGCFRGIRHTPTDYF